MPQTATVLVATASSLDLTPQEVRLGADFCFSISVCASSLFSVCAACNVPQYKAISATQTCLTCLPRTLPYANLVFVPCEDMCGLQITYVLPVTYRRLSSTRVHKVPLLVFDGFDFVLVLLYAARVDLSFL